MRVFQVVFPFLFFSLTACQGDKSAGHGVEEIDLWEGQTINYGLEKLSEYGFFKSPMKDLEPEEGVIPYRVNAQLFSDYAYKARFVKIPEGNKAAYHDSEVFDFPEGTILIKNFYYPDDFREPEGKRRIIETRLLILEDGVWVALPYIWNDDQTEALLSPSGASLQVSWTHFDGASKVVNYTVPNVNDCKSCHLKGAQLVPIGPSARQLNGDYDYSSGTKNQLVMWNEAGILDALPDLQPWPRLADYDNREEYTLDRRARAWLEVNCGHCHSADGPAKSSGLHLQAHINDPYRLGIGKSPVAAGKGSGGRKYSIVPGRPDASILMYRIESDEPGIMMPELGRRINHQEGVALIREWIESLKDQ